jgi:predicted nucleic acid-binding protein
VIIATALQIECTMVYSENLQTDRVIERRLKIINPFANGIKEPFRNSAHVHPPD